MIRHGASSVRRSLIRAGCLSFQPIAQLRTLRLKFDRGYASAAVNDDRGGLPPALIARARAIAEQHADLTETLADRFDSKIAKKLGDLQSTTDCLAEWEKAHTAVNELQTLIEDDNADAELRDLAGLEIDESRQTLRDRARDLQTSLIPRHPFASLPCLLEVRPGAGGSEAAIFSGDLLRMYQAWCRRYRLPVQVLKWESVAGESDTLVQEGILEISSEGAYELLRCEAGVHRVQRVPSTERQGRTHTSAASVIVLPSFPENAADVLGAANFDDPNSDYYIDAKDVRTDTMRASGAGGQHVNMTDSAVRLTHVPTNTVVAVQDQRSQHKNRQKAWQILRARLAQARREAREDEMARLRLSVVGVAKMGRGDKIRTYNWSQQRVTDHRSGITVHGLTDVVQGGLSLDTVMQSVRAWIVEQDLAAMSADDTVKSQQK